MKVKLKREELLRILGEAGGGIGSEEITFEAEPYLDEQVEKEFNCIQNVHTEIPCNDCEPKKPPELPKELKEEFINKAMEHDPQLQLIADRQNQIIRYLKAKE